MQSIGAFDAKTHFSALLQQVEKGEQVLITKHGRPVAKLVSVTGSDRQQLQQTIKRLKTFGKDIKLGLDWKMLRDEGRR